MNDISKNILHKLTKEERFISGRRSCKGCSKALTARIAAKAIADTAGVPASLLPGISQQLSSLSSQAYAYDPVTTTGMINQFLSTLDEINNISAQEISSANRSIQKAVIGIDRRFLENDYLAFTQVAESTGRAIFICFDSEPHMADLLKRAIPKPFILNEDPVPVTDQDVQKVIRRDIMHIPVADGDFSYIATACPSYPRDLVSKVKKALEVPGNCFIQVLTPCPSDWIFPPERSLKVGIKAAETGYFPLYEIQDGRVHITKRIVSLKPLDEFFNMQKRFQTLPMEHLPVIQTAVTDFYKALMQEESVA